MSENLGLKSQIQATHTAAIENIKKDLFAKAQQQVDFSKVDVQLDQQILGALKEEGKQKLESIQQHAKEEVLKAYNGIIAWMASEHLTDFQSENIVSEAQKKLKEKMELTKSELFAGLSSEVVNDEQLSENKLKLEQALQQSGLSQSLDKVSEQLGKSLVSFGPGAINTYKAKLSLHNEQLNKKKTDAHLTANVFDPNTFTPDPMVPIDYDYKIDIDKLREHIKHKLANLKPGEKLHINVDIPPDRADILKKIAETGFQYRIPFVALLLLLFIELKMNKKDDETRTVSAIEELIKKDHISLRAEDITFSIKARGNDGKMQTLLEPRPLDPAVAAWKLNKPLQALRNILYPAMGVKKQTDEPEKLSQLQSNCRQELERTGLNSGQHSLVR